jgi:phage-related protein
VAAALDGVTLTAEGDVVVNLDGKEIGRVTARFTSQEMRRRARG